ncbi:TetR family transcriptional regulator [Amycolatopsis rhabdoformis]|uniref:TetR family transcriptional regulator n=1 Tax=Amycolatopsis rhabdoformis TaxID=1448059 RepID=A0ABZ1HVF6_9PSEU|nr:TetR family transcriptional regulator [Amycolatopsis rhabdoformis]WSE26265.1 TetR family transcriptional regulator [Amycolatopsis rhabdoformis]
MVERNTTRKSPRRTDALSRERITAAAVELLDAAGEGGLTFRALSERLATGPGAIYWHVANKSELLEAATDAVVAAALPAPVTPVAADECVELAKPEAPVRSPQDEIRAVALGLFTAIAEHPWLATQVTLQLSLGPAKPVPLRLFESLGRQVGALGVPQESWFTAASALMHYILGAAAQNASNARVAGSEVGRAEFLDAVSAAWEELDPDEYPFTRAVARQARDHDDREQFLAGIDLILAGTAAR